MDAHTILHAYNIHIYPSVIIYKSEQVSLSLCVAELVHQQSIKLLRKRIKLQKRLNAYASN